MSALSSTTLAPALAAIASNLPGVLGVTLRFLEEGVSVQHNGDEIFPAASVIKVPIMVQAYRQAEAGEVDLDGLVRLGQDDKVAGSGLLQYLHAGLELTVRDAIELMIVVSDNTATNLMLDQLGFERVNRTMEGLGLPNTWSGGYIGSAKRLSQTTPNEMADLLTRMVRRDLVTPTACDAMLATLERQLYDDGLPRRLPVVAYPEKIGLDTSPVRVAHKTGALSGVRNDAGVVLCEMADGLRTIVVSVFTKDLDDGEIWTPDNIGLQAVADITRMAYDAQLAMVDSIT